MIAVVQRVAQAAVSAAETGFEARIGRGLCVLLAVEVGDSEREADWVAAKIAHLRVFPDAEYKMNLSVQEIAGEALVVSQFTLAGDCSRGNRPSFVAAAAPESGERLYEEVCRRLRSDHRLPVKTGVFRAMMQVTIVNDGPVTLIVRRTPEVGAAKPLETPTEGAEPAKK